MVPIGMQISQQPGPCLISVLETLSGTMKGQVLTIDRPAAVSCVTPGKCLGPSEPQFLHPYNGVHQRISAFELGKEGLNGYRA